MQEPSYRLGKIVLVSIWFRRIGPNNKSSKQRFSHLEIHTKYQYLIDMMNLMLMDKFFDTHIDLDY